MYNSKAIHSYPSLHSSSHSAFLPVKTVSLPGAALTVFRAPKDSKILVWVFLAILHSTLAGMDDDQSLREETEKFPWYLLSSCHLDVSQLPLLLFSACVYLPHSPLKLMFSFLSSYYWYSLARVWYHQPEVLKAAHEFVVSYHFMSLYQTPYSCTNNLNPNKFSVKEFAGLWP